MKLSTLKCVFLLGVMCSVLLQIPHTFAAKAPDGPNFVPLGVYLSWELTEFWAKEANIDRWEDVQKRLDILANKNVNTLWVTNMIQEDIPKLLNECEKRNMKLIIRPTKMDVRWEWPTEDPNHYYRTLIPNLIALAGSSPTLTGWVLSDEPLEKDMPKVEKIRELFQEYDPNRFTLTVTMYEQTPLVPKLTNVNVVCTDIYPFFGPNDRNGPHTDDSSKTYYRAGINRMINAIGNKKMKPWVMPQCFTEIWGPFTCDPNGDVIALPGSYYHWRMPTCAEIRWQVWEAIRGQAKGIVFFQAAPIISCSEETAKRPPFECSWKEILLKESVNTGPGALLTRTAKTTIQMDELGEIYGRLLPLTKIIYNWKPTKELIAESKHPAQIQNFSDSESGRFYSVIVNDNLQSKEETTVRLEPQTKQVIDVISGKSLSLTEEFAGGIKTVSFPLKAGDGTIIQIIR
ncbi:MAG: hypothetical protein A2Y12_17080 [Planctomycetes bacterium GWF2_42_9]|nr:MAG: hypothetical protein A2Y12_17080 [Planctomycetes bacterium GWF2_42_9]